MHGYYPPGGPGGFGGVPIPQLIRGQHYMEAPHMMHNMDYVTDQFQGYDHHSLCSLLEIFGHDIINVCMWIQSNLYNVKTFVKDECPISEVS